MSRFYLICLLLTLPFLSQTQNNLKKYLKFAQEQYDNGDYYHALMYYKKAMEVDSNTVDILWNMAETNLAYKDYRLAEYYYSKVYERESGGIYPSSLLKLAMMQKQNGKYHQAVETLKRCKKKYYKKKKSYLYQKTKRELASTVWALSAMKDSVEGDLILLPTTVNSKNSEFGHILYNNALYFSSLRPDSISTNEEVFSTDYKTLLYSSAINDQEFETSKKIEDLIENESNIGNGTFSLDGTRFYFSKCTEDGYNYICKIMVAYYRQGKWTNIDELGEIINIPGSNTTMPHIANFENRETLFFSSNREGGKGGMDIYYSVIKNGNQFGKVRNVKSINTIQNDITPWYDQESKELYFSSPWHNGFGGYDIHSSKYLKKFEKPNNAGAKINSPANDTYFFKQSDTVYFTSNRVGVHYSKNITCCSDIFSIVPLDQMIPITPKETLEELNLRLPVTLYFHNDIPNPRSRDTTTKVNYIDSYHDYISMIEEYQTEYSKGLKGIKVEEAKEDIESFFIEYVEKGVNDLELFRNLLLEELDKGARIKVTVKGFASPLAKTEYNVHLTKRRIASLINYLMEYDKGQFKQYIEGVAKNGGQVIFEQVPFGEYTANQLTSDNPHDTQNSVFSRSAGIERKIEIQSVTYLEQIFPLFTQHTVFNAGTVNKTDKVSHRFLLSNTSQSVIRIKDLKISCDYIMAKPSQTNINPGESIYIDVNVNTTNLTGFNYESIEVSINDSDEKLSLIINIEIK